MLTLCSTLLALVHHRARRGAITPGAAIREPASCAISSRCSLVRLVATAGSLSPKGYTAVDPRSPVLLRLARACVLRDTRDGRALASAGLAPALALEVPLSRWTSASQSRATELDRDHVPRQTRCTPRRTSYVERVAVTSSSVPASRPRGVALACPPARCAWTANAGNVVWVLPVLAFVGRCPGLPAGKRAAAEPAAYTGSTEGEYVGLDNYIEALFRDDIFH